MTNENQLSPIDQFKVQIYGKESGKIFEALLPKHFDVEQFKASLFLEVKNNHKLLQCDNIIDLARDCANFGLLPNGLAGQCYFIPFGNKAKLIIGYKGYVTKLEQAGYTIECELVTKEEIEQGRFEEVRGSEIKIIHKPLRNCIRTRETIALAYAIVRKQGLAPVISVLSKEEIEEMAKTEKWIGSKKTNDLRKIRALGNVWTQNQRSTDFGQMCIKTVIRNVAKKVDLAIANEMSSYEGKRDEEVMKDVTPTARNFFEEKMKQAKERVDVTQKIPSQEELAAQNEQQPALTDKEIAKITKAPGETKQSPLTEDEKKEIDGDE